MTKKFKIRYLLIAMILIAIITASTAFSVSYASWVGNNSEVTAGITLGQWDSVGESVTSKYSHGIVVIGENGVVDVEMAKEPDFTYTDPDGNTVTIVYNLYRATITVTENQKFKLFYDIDGDGKGDEITYFNDKTNLYANYTDGYFVAKGDYTLTVEIDKKDNGEIEVSFTPKK